jgi:ATP-binding cassette subfamily F protein 3
MIILKDVQLLRQQKILLNHTSLTVYPKQKIGIVGNNGSGKSTLLALLQHQVELDHGSLEIPKQWKTTSIAQSISNEDLEQSAINYVINGDQAYRELEKNIQEAQDNDKHLILAQLHEKMHDIDGYTIHARASALISGLGFKSDQVNNQVRSFSGGWQMRLNLARALLCPSDLLLLDEPTNHLDLDAVIWLESWLKQYHGTLWIVSHDRDFLDSVVNHIVHIEEQKLNLYQGNYSRFEILRAEKRAQISAERQKQIKERAHIQGFVDRFRAKASKAKQVQSRLKALDKMAQIENLNESQHFNIGFLKPEKMPMPLMVMRNVSAGYAQNIILDRIQINMTPGARIGLLGQNGTGKSTFMKLLAQKIAPLSGEYSPGPGLKIGYFAQHQLETLDKCQTPIAHMQQLNRDATEQELRDYLGQFGFSGNQVFDKVEHFSGGEKSRLALALIIHEKPNLLLLDEPTNHLDIEMRQALTLALQSYDGAMVIVSHDRYLLNTTCNEFYLVSDGAITPFEGDLEQYHQWLLQNKLTASSSPEATGLKHQRKSQKRVEAQKRQELAPYRKSLLKVEQRLNTQQQEKIQLELDLADESLYLEANAEKLQKTLSRLNLLNKKIEITEQEWLALETQIEEIDQSNKG